MIKITILIIAVIIHQARSKVGSTVDELKKGEISAELQITYSGFGYMYSVMIGPDENTIYFTTKYDNPANNTAIIQTDTDLNIQLAKTYDKPGVERSFSIGDNSLIYFQVENTNYFNEINSNSLDILRQINIGGLSYTRKTKLVVTSQIFLSIRYANSTCKVGRIPQSGTLMDCFDYESEILHNFVPITLDKIFIATTKGTVGDYYLMSASFSSPSSFNWAKFIDCPLGGTACASTPSYSILSNSGSYIYSLILFNNRVLFYTLDATSGNPLIPGVLHSTGRGEAWKILEIDDYLILVFEINESSVYKYIISYINRITGVGISEFDSSGSPILGINKIIYNNTPLFYMNGKKTPNFLIKRLIPNQMENLSILTERTNSWAYLTSEYLIQDVFSPTALNFTSQTFAVSGSITTVAAGLTYTPTYNYMPIFHNEDFKGNILSKVKVDLSFSWAGSPPQNISTITFSLEQLDGESLPSWIYLDGTNQVLTLNKTPSVTTTSSYKFSLKIQSGSETWVKKFYLNVGFGKVNNCKTGNSDNYTLCKEGQAGKIRSAEGEKCYAVKNTEVKAATQALLGIGIAVSAATSLTSMTSNNGMYSMINQFQLYFLLPMIGSYLPAKIVDFILSMDFVMFSFDFLKIEQVEPIKSFNNWISYPQENTYLEELGHRTGSAVINIISLSLMLGLIGLIHFILFWMKWTGVKSSGNSKFKKIFEKIFIFVQFNLYIRFILEAFIFISISVISELNSMDLNSDGKIISIAFAALILILKVGFVLLGIRTYYLSFPKIDTNRYPFTQEYLSGVKDNAWAKANSLVFMFARLLSVLTVILIPTSQYEGKLILFTLIHCIFTIYFIFIRPYDNKIDNVIDTLHQVNFFILIFPLIFLKYESDWNNTYEDIFIYVLMSGPAIGCLINTSLLIKVLSEKFTSITPLFQKF